MIFHPEKIKKIGVGPNNMNSVIPVLGTELCRISGENYMKRCSAKMYLIIQPYSGPRLRQS